MPRTRRSVPFDLLVPPHPIHPLQADLASLSTGALDFAHVLFVPMHYEPGYAYPLIVWLHGRGGDERQLSRIMPLVSMRNYVAVAPRGFLVAEPRQLDRVDWPQTDEHIPLAEQRVFDCIELASRKCHVSPKRVFLAGFDAGGTMALRLALNHPNRFAGAISLCGRMPAGRALFGNLVSVRRLGLFLASGRTSLEYPAEQVCEDLKLLHAAGLSVTLRQYPCAQELHPQMLSDLDRWIIEQITPPAAVRAESDPEWSREAE